MQNPRVPLRPVWRSFERFLLGLATVTTSLVSHQLLILLRFEDQEYLRQNLPECLLLLLAPWSLLGMTVGYRRLVEKATRQNAPPYPKTDNPNTAEGSKRRPGNADSL